MKKIVFLVFCLACFAMAGTAQIKLGVTGSFNVSTLSGLDQTGASFSGEYAIKGKSKTGFNVGIMAQFDIPFTNFFIQPELLYSNIGAKEETRIDAIEYKRLESTSWGYLQLPIYAGYKFNAGLGLDVIVGVGPYLGYALHVDQEDILNDRSDYFDRHKRFDAGLTAMTGIQFHKIQVALGYDLGLVNRRDTSLILDLWLDKINFRDTYNRSLKVSVGYFF